MKLVERNGLRILYPKYGYLLRNVITNDTYDGKIYLGANSSPEDFEEVKDNDVNEILANTVEDMEAKEESLTKIGKIVANQVTDDVVALSIQEFYDIWEPNMKYIKGQYVNHKEILYKVLQDHLSQEGWTPDATPSLYAKVLIDPTGETVLDWVQPDSTNAYMKGDKVLFEGITYVSTVDNNVWQPGVYGWEIVQ